MNAGVSGDTSAGGVSRLDWSLDGDVRVLEANDEALRLLGKTRDDIVGYRGGDVLECAHALAWIIRAAPEMKGQTVLMNLSGRGDKDVGQMMDVLKLGGAK